jgi:hypothetical protein
MQSELRIDCPQCDNLSVNGRYDPVAYLNTDKETYYCHRCHASGKAEELDLENLNVISIKDKLPFNTEAFEELKPLTEEAKAYLAKRFPGVSLDSLAPFNLRYSSQYHAIAIPTYNAETGLLQGIKYRLIAPMGDARFLAEEASQFGGYWIDGKQDKLLIVEGELDAITAKVCGFEGTVLSLQTNKLSEESVKRLRSFKHIFLALDNDKAGNAGAEEISKLLYPRETERLVMPEGIKDFNELLQKEGTDGTNRFIQEATRTQLERDSISLSGALSEMVAFLSDRRNTHGDSTGWKSVDNLLGGGLRPNEMSVVNAFAKTGKTSFINNVVHNLACLGKRVAIASFEMDPARTLYPSLLSIAGQTNIRGITDRETLQRSVELLSKECSYLSNLITLRRFGYTPWEEVEEWAALMKERHQIEYLVLDHAGFMVEKMTDADQNQELAKQIKKLTNTLGLHILIVVQAPKTKDGLSLQTAYGGMAWSQNADNFFILERDKDDDTLLKVRLEAARYPGANPSNTPAHLFYDKETCTLSE